MTSEFSGQTVVITGAAGGIGCEVALRLGAAGAQVAIFDRDSAGAETVVNAVESAGGRAAFFRVDVSESAQVSGAFQAAQRTFGSISYLVNIAGTDAVAEVQDISDGEWSRMFAIAVNGTFYTCRAALPGMMSRRCGRIVNMSSLHAIRGQSGRAHYAAAKAAIIGFTKSLAREKAPYNIRANAVAPGPIDTALWRAGLTGEALQQAMEQRSKIIPLGRLGQPQEVVGAILFLLSSDSNYITGQVITLDGGEVMP